MVTAGDLRTTTGHAQVDEIIASIVTGYEAALPGLALGFEQRSSRYLPYNSGMKPVQSLATSSPRVHVAMPMGMPCPRLLAPGGL
jgi:hypothetical protein